ncbi:histidine--tRNA ligase [Candidatus Microgenomates bacterium]|nr:histidine--tRNA ligase [Candidatus Microgenomates bacterium]
MKKNKLQTLKGFRDFYPEDMAFQSWLYGKIKKVSEAFGFQEYEGPTVESLDLYAAKSGEELVKKQAFTWKDNSDRTIALRPEMTPTLAKMIVQKEGSLTFPVKWFTYGRRFRYEQPQKGRGREFFQWDVDILGSNSLLSDTEAIAIAATFYKELGLTPKEVVIKVNDRELILNSLSEIGVAEDKTKAILKIIDKKYKVGKEIFEKLLLDQDLSNKQTKDIIAMTNNTKLYEKSDWLMGIKNRLKLFGVSEYIEFDPSIVRGLDYYTKTVFEGWVKEVSFRSIWGGGRYDNLTSDVGGKQKIAGVGFAMGDMVIEEVLRFFKKYPVLKTVQSDVLVSVFSPQQLESSIKIARELRDNGINTELFPDENTRLDKQLKYADKKQIPYVVIIGPEEVKNKLVTLKNMKTKEQKKVTIEEVCNLLK